ncbi:MAG: nucleotidyltransferase family protein [Thermoplasmata archaeon]
MQESGMTDNKGPPSKSAVLRKLSSSAEKLREFGVRRIGLFGSVRAGRAREDSDIDLLVEFEPGRETFADLMGLHSFLTQLLGGKIDLVTVGGLSPYLGPHILREVEYAEGLH